MNLDIEKLQQKVFQERQRRRAERLKINTTAQENEKDLSGFQSIFHGLAEGIIISIIILGVLYFFIIFKNEIEMKMKYCFQQMSPGKEKQLSTKVANTNKGQKPLNTIDVSDNRKKASLSTEYHIPFHPLHNAKELSLENDEYPEGISQSETDGLVNKSYLLRLESDLDYGPEFYEWIVKAAKKMNTEGRYSVVIAWLKFHEEDRVFQSSLFYNELGYAYRQEGKHELAIDKYKKALELNPAYTPSVNGLFKIYVRQQKYAEIKTLINSYIVKGGRKKNLSQEALLWLNESGHIKNRKLNT